MDNGLWITDDGRWKMMNDGQQTMDKRRPTRTDWERCGILEKIKRETTQRCSVRHDANLQLELQEVGD